MSTRKSDPAIAAATGWSGRFSEPVAELVKRYTASVDFDKRLADVGHRRLARACAHAGRGRRPLRGRPGRDRARPGGDCRRDSGAAHFAWSPDLEDVHLNIEKRLTALIGDAGKRLHTGRSRNDQVATDLRLYVRAAIDDIGTAIVALRSALLDLAEPHAATIMPGFTHLQVAQPVTFGHHLLAYEAMLARDSERLIDCRRRVNRLPLGSAALAGTSFPIDRDQVARELGFEGLCAQFARCGVGSRLRDRIRRRRRADDDAPVALRRRARAVVEPALRFRAPRRPLLHRQLDHAAKEKSRCSRAGARQDRTSLRRPGCAADA